MEAVVVNIIHRLAKLLIAGRMLKTQFMVAEDSTYRGGLEFSSTFVFLLLCGQLRHYLPEHFGSDIEFVFLAHFAGFNFI